MPTYITDRDGVTLHVQYTLDPDNVVAFSSVQVADATYCPVGPDLTPLLDNLVLMVSYMPPVGKPFLSVLVEEIEREQVAKKPN